MVRHKQCDLHPVDIANSLKNCSILDKVQRTSMPGRYTRQLLDMFYSLLDLADCSSRSITQRRVCGGGLAISGCCCAVYGHFPAVTLFRGWVICLKSRIDIFAAEEPRLLVSFYFAL